MAHVTTRHTALANSTPDASERIAASIPGYVLPEARCGYCVSIGAQSQHRSKGRKERPSVGQRAMEKERPWRRRPQDPDHNDVQAWSQRHAPAQRRMNLSNSHSPVTLHPLCR